MYSSTSDLVQKLREKGATMDATKQDPETEKIPETPQPQAAAPSADPQPGDEEADDGDEDEDEDEEGDPSDGPPHPFDILESCIEEAQSQCRRLGSVGNINVKGELKNNVYPLMAEAFRAMADFIDATEESLEQVEIGETLKNTVIDAAAKMKSLVSLAERNKEVIGCMPEADQKEFNEIISWAKTTISAEPVKE
jgi:hypothetical protein